MASGSSSSHVFISDEDFLDATESQAVDLLLAEAGSFSQAIPFLGDEVGANPDTFPPALMEHLTAWVSSFLGKDNVADTISRMQVLLSFLGGAGQCGVEAKEIRNRARALCKKVLDTKPAILGLLSRKQKASEELRSLRAERGVLVSSRNEASSALAAAETRANAAETREQELSRECQSLRQLVSDLEEKIRKMGEESEAGLAERNGLSSQVGILQSERDELMARLGDAEQKVAAEAERASKAEAKAGDLETRMASLQETSQRLRLRAREESSLVSSLEEELTQAEAAAAEEKAVLRRQIEQLQQEVEDLKAELEEDEDGGSGEDGDGEGSAAP